MKSPALDPRGEWTYRCTGCGEEINSDHDYCSPCDQRGGEWELTGPDGEPVDINHYGEDTFAELVSAAARLLTRIEEVCESPEMQKVVDEHGNSAARILRGGIRVSRNSLAEVVIRAKQGKSS